MPPDNTLRQGTCASSANLPYLLAEQDSFSLILLAVVFGLMGEGLTRTTVRMQSLRKRLRFAAGTLGVLSGCVMFAFYLSTDTMGGPDGLLACVFAAALAAVWSTMFWYCGVCVLTFLYQHVVAPPFRALARSQRRARQQASWQRSSPPPPPDSRIKQEAESRKAEAQRRRTDARAKALLAYSMHAPKLGSRFTRDMFDQYVKEFMGDQFPPEDVERRGQELLAIFERHEQALDPPRETRTIEDLARWFQDQKNRIESLPVEDRVKRTHLANLNERYAELTSKLLQDMEP